MRIKINVIEKKENHVPNRNQTDISDSAILKTNSPLWQFSAFKGVYPGLQSETDFKVRIQTVFQIHLLPFFEIMHKKVHRNGLTQMYENVHRNGLIQKKKKKKKIADI